MIKKEKCRDIQSQIQDYLDGKLSPEMAAEIEEHLHACPACRKEFTAWQKLFQQLNSMPQERLSPDFTF